MSVRALVAVGGLVTAILAVAFSPGGGREPVAQTLGIDPATLETGDLIFRRGQTLLSRLVLAGDTQSVYSHVGLLSMNGAYPVVIHIAPAGSAAGGDQTVVRAEPLADFIDPKRATAVAVLRLNSGRDSYVSSVVAAARRYERRGVSFDARFDLETDERMYCTELVWKAYLEAGIDLVEGVFGRLDTPFGGKSVLLPSSLLRSPHLREIASSEIDHH